MTADECALLSMRKTEMGAVFAKNILALGLYDEIQLLTLICKHLNTPPVAPGQLCPTEAGAEDALPRALMHSLEVVPLGWEGRRLRVAMVDPFERETLAQLQFFCQCEIQPTPATLSSIYATLRQQDPNFLPVQAPVEKVLRAAAASVAPHVVGATEPNQPATPPEPGRLGQPPRPSRPALTPPFASKEQISAQDEFTDASSDFESDDFAGSDELFALSPELEQALGMDASPAPSTQDVEFEVSDLLSSDLEGDLELDPGQPIDDLTASSAGSAANELDLELDPDQPVDDLTASSAGSAANELDLGLGLELDQDLSSPPLTLESTRPTAEAAHPPAARSQTNRIHLAATKLRMKPPKNFLPPTLGSVLTGLGVDAEFGMIAHTTPDVWAERSTGMPANPQPWSKLIAELNTTESGPNFTDPDSFFFRTATYWWVLKPGQPVASSERAAWQNLLQTLAKKVDPPALA